MEPGHKDISIGPSFYHLPLFSFQRSKARFEEAEFRPEKNGQKISERVNLLLSPVDRVNLFFGRCAEFRRGFLLAATIRIYNLYL